MSDFTYILPPEIITKVLFYLDQKSCVECTRVCRRWFSSIPKYATPLWNQLNISLDSWWKVNTPLLQFLGPHVKNVSIVSKETGFILQRLKRHDCNIQFLVIVDPIYSSPFLRDHTKNVTMHPFYASLELFANTLTELTIDCQQYHISLTTLLDTLPLLTHLTVKYGASYIEPIYTVSDNNNNNNNSNSNRKSKIVFLCLDNTSHFSTLIHPILLRCPELKFLLLSNFRNEFKYFPMYMDQIQTTIQSCPSIQYISMRKIDMRFWTHVKNLEKRWICMSRKMIIDKNKNNSNKNFIQAIEKGSNTKHEWELIDKKEKTLRELEFSGIIHHEQLFSILKKSQHTLEHLHYSFVNAEQLQYTIEQNPLLHFPHLKSIELTTLDNLTGKPTWIFKGLFDMHQQQLEHLYLDFKTLEGSDPILQQVINNMIEAISKLKKLQYLFLEFQNQCTVYCDNLDLLSSNNTELRDVTFINIPILDQGLMELSKLPQLCMLELRGYNVHRLLTEDGFIAFANKLKELNSPLELLDLNCDHTSAVTDTVLKHLCQVESLKTLRISANHDITDEGVNIYFGAKKRRIELSCCNLVSQNNSNVLFIQ
ncbi:hypothetical protein BDC45DRAFT_558174 [Circinella umbellata]|nr:hypothetical protein BDC45DRAFT_558174 [Circinella umbellata]